MGIGPKLFAMTMLYSFLLALFINHSNYNFSINIIPCCFLIALGTLLIIIGIAFLIPSIIAISKANKVDGLSTKGIYSICRHPLYSSWIIFIVPGIILLSNSWILLTVPLIMYLIFRILIKEEEIYLLNKHGNQYIEYKKRVVLLFPALWKYSYKKEPLKSTAPR